jgi:hypothetical protein
MDSRILRALLLILASGVMTVAGAQTDAGLSQISAGPVDSNGSQQRRSLALA